MKKTGLVVVVASVFALLLWGSSQAAQVTTNIVSGADVPVYGPQTTPFNGIIPAADSNASIVFIPDEALGWPTITGAAWITSPTAADPTSTSYLLFEEDIIPPCTASKALGTLLTTANSSVDVSLITSGSPLPTPIGSASIPKVSDPPIQFEPVQGGNTLVFEVETQGITGTTPPQNPAGLIYSAVITYDVPDVVWRPPILGTKRTIVKNGTTLPIKFRLRDAAGRMRTPQNIYLSITGPYLSETDIVPEVVRFTRGKGGKVLRFSRGNGEYKANFQTKLYDLKTDPGLYYKISVNDGCTDETLAFTKFKVFGKGKKVK
jgi:hypothetical protein